MSELDICTLVDLLGYTTRVVQGRKRLASVSPDLGL